MLARSRAARWPRNGRELQKLAVSSLVFSSRNLQLRVPASQSHRSLEAQISCGLDHCRLQIELSKTAGRNSLELKLQPVFAAQLSSDHHACAARVASVQCCVCGWTFCRMRTNTRQDTCSPIKCYSSTPQIARKYSVPQCRPKSKCPHPAGERGQRTPGSRVGGSEQALVRLGAYPSDWMAGSSSFLIGTRW
jgi:hypothetical protein